MRRRSRRRVPQGATGRPRRHDGAPLRPVKTDVTNDEWIESSPSSRRGSIAASSARRSATSTSRASSPSSRRGSIAAPPPGSRPCRRSRRPRRHDGAPLRRSSRVHPNIDLVVVPVVTTGLHCGLSACFCIHSPTRVVPVVTTGLHCGRNRSVQFCPFSERRPRRHDGAPLRPHLA